MRLAALSTRIFWAKLIRMGILLVPGFLQLLFPLNAMVVEAKHIVVFGGMMRSHHLTVVPLIEGLLERGHEVSFLI